MKVLYLHQYFNTPDMAGGTRSYEMARRLVAWGHEVHVITSWRDSTTRTEWYEELIDGIHVHWLPVPYENAMGFMARIKAFIRFALLAGQRAVSIGGDVVFATSTPLTIALPGIYASKRLSLPMVFEVRDLWPEVPIAMGVLRNPLLIYFSRWLERFAYANSQRVVALSEGMSAGVQKAGFPSARIDVIPNSSDLELFAYDEAGAKRFRDRHPELGDGPIVLYPGTLGRVNGVSYLVEVAHCLRDTHPNLRFVVIGNGAEWAKVQERAKERGVLNVNFFQYQQIPKRALADAFSAAAVITSVCIDEPALWANSANKFFDALAAGKAIAINYQGWQADLLISSGAGLVLSPNPNHAAPVLAQFISNLRAVAEAGSRARQIAEKEFSRDLLARKLEKTLEKAIGQLD